ncbi:MAG TPA: SMC-Scp complex subunit ScpB [Conexibacter sp.]|jgi:segregation and condensation protein B|nr:SMC-Scp complex subunit ScpB [Conexibacter sp.]
MIELAGTLEALLFLCPDPVPASALADAVGIEEDEAAEALSVLAGSLDSEGRGLVLRELSGGWQLSSHPEAEDAARRLLAKPRTPPLTPAQAETLAIVAYLQPVSRPEIARIRGVNAESAAQTLIERGVIEEAGRSQFGAVLYRTTDLFLRLFGLQSVDQLPDVTAWDPSPDVAANIRERLLRAGEARLGVPAAAAPAEGREGEASAEPEEPSADADAADGIEGAEPEPADEREPAPVIPIA